MGRLSRQALAPYRNVSGAIARTPWGSTHLARAKIRSVGTHRR